MKITDLAETLCGAMGLHPELGSMSVEYLTDHDLLEGGDAKAEPSHAAGLLIALAGSGEMYAPHKTVERYWRLELTTSMIGQYWGDAAAIEPMPADFLYASDILERDARFGEVLISIISSYVFGEMLGTMPGNIIIGYGPGLTRSDIHLWPPVLVEGHNGFILGFSTGETMLPDDAPRARLERTATVPAPIFDVLREAMGGKTAPPTVLEPLYFEPDSIDQTPAEEV